MRKLADLIILIALTAAGARAGLISINLDAPTQTGRPGDILRYFGTIKNIDTALGDAPVFLNNDNLNLAIIDTVNSDLFFANVPLSLAEGASSGDIELFDYALANPEADLFGLHSGVYGLLGGMDGGANTAQGILAQVNFFVNIQPASSSLPEPSTWLLLLGGIVLLAVSRRCLVARQDSLRR